MQSQIEEMATSGLKVALENKVKLIENQITYSIANTKTLNTSIFLTQSLEKIYVDEFNAEGIAGLVKSVDKILTTHFIGIKIRDVEGNLILNSGINSTSPDLAVELDTGSDVHTVLLWDEQFIVRNSIQLLDEKNKPIGRITTEEPMPDLTRIFKEATLIGKTGDFLLCAPVKENDLEMDCFLR
ncbi:MAG: diguanylate cyclase, partial [Nitrosomonas sp.]|nr:diguanylate cyclase [Nitrosomonas sp.]